MQHLNLTLHTPAENLALDEALLDALEDQEISGGVLRLWELPQHCVVMGRSSQAENEVNLAACHQTGVPVLRRSSGGAAVVVGPGCLMYSLVMDYDAIGPPHAIDRLHNYVLGRLGEMLTGRLPGVSLAGTSDLVAVDTCQSQATGTNPVPRKFSGNALRMKRNSFLYHGTLLYDFDLQRIDQLLKMPRRQPDYRAGRVHGEFVANLAMTREELSRSLVESWNAREPLGSWPHQRVARLVEAKYATDSAWTIPPPRRNAP